MGAQAKPGIRGMAADRLIVAVLLGALAVRAAVLNARSLWFDEAFSVAVARLPLPQVWQVIARTDAHPPLHYLLLHMWMRLGDTPAMVRLLSLLFGVLGVAVVWWLARALGGPLVATTAGILMAASALSIQASVEARMFSLLALLSTGATAALWHASAKPEQSWRWAIYGILLALAWYVGYLAFLLVPAHVAYLALNHRRNAFVQRGMLIALGAAAVLYAPWWPAMAGQLGEGRATRIWNGAMPPTAPINIVALSSFGGYLLGLGGYLLDNGRWSWPQLLLILPFLVLVGVGAATIPRRGGSILLLAWSVPVLTLLGLSLFTGLFYAIPRYVSFVQPFFIVLLAQGIIAVTSRSRRVFAFVGMTAGIVVLNLIVLQASLADVRYQPYDWAGAARHVQERWRAGDRLLFYPHTARVAFGYYFIGGAEGAVTLYPPPWTRRFTRAQLVRAFPSVSTLVKNAPRLWLVLTEPVPPQSREALLEVVERTYLRREVNDFRYVYVLLYERRGNH